MIISCTSHPFILMARYLIERDNGGFHRESALDPSMFEVPDGRWSPDDLNKVEQGLLCIRLFGDHDAFETFCIGEQTEQEGIARMYAETARDLPMPGDTEMASRFLNDYFNAWEDA
jgi:hypothetical protein